MEVVKLMAILVVQIVGGCAGALLLMAGHGLAFAVILVSTLAISLWIDKS